MWILGSGCGTLDKVEDNGGLHMKSRALRIIFVVVVISTLLSSCSQADMTKSTHTPSTELTNTTEATPASTSETTDSPESEDSISFFQYETIVINNILIGAWNGKGWINAETLYPMLPDRNQYTLHIGSYDTLTDIGRKDMVWPIVDGAIIFDSMDENKLLWRWQDYIAVSNEKHLHFWFHEEDHPGNPIFQKLADEVCSDSGYPNLKLPVRKVFDVGLKEIEKIYFIIADNDYASGQKGIVQFLRMTVDGIERNYIIAKNFWDSDGPYYETMLKYACDLNRDGMPEIITYSQGLGETVWGVYHVYSLQDNEFVCVLSAGWFD